MHIPLPSRRHRYILDGKQTCARYGDEVVVPLLYGTQVWGTLRTCGLVCEVLYHFLDRRSRVPIHEHPPIHEHAFARPVCAHALTLTYAALFACAVEAAAHTMTP